jgi:uncharacterized protein YbjT (DUF2867 family)
MRVLVIGATGQTGRHVVSQLLARDHEVTAFARNPSAINEREHLRAAQGDARDLQSIERAMAGQNAVIVTFGPRSLEKDDLQEVLMRNPDRRHDETRRHAPRQSLRLGGGRRYRTSRQPDCVRYFFLPIVLRQAPQRPAVPSERSVIAER